MRILGIDPGIPGGLAIIMVNDGAAQRAARITVVQKLH
jgi:hypothetical protein